MPAKCSMHFGVLFADSDSEDDRPTLSSSGTATGDSAGSRVAGRRDRSRSRHGRIEPGGSAHSRVAQAGDALGVADRAEVSPDKWIGLFARFIRCRREAFGTQLRPLILHTMYTGTNSQSMVLGRVPKCTGAGRQLSHPVPSAVACAVCVCVCVWHGGSPAHLYREVGCRERCAETTTYLYCCSYPSKADGRESESL